MVGALLLLVVVLVGAVSDPSDEAAPTTTLATPPAPTTTASTEAPSSTTAAPDPAETTAPAVRPPDQVRVLVVNGAGIQGVARRISDGIAAAGYPTLPPGNTDRRSVSTLYVRLGYDQECAAIVALLQPRFTDPLPTEPLSESPEVEGRDEADCIALIGDDIVGTD
jgi:hypothetical protein